MLRSVAAVLELHLPGMARQIADQPSPASASRWARKVFRRSRPSSSVAETAIAGRNASIISVGPTELTIALTISHRLYVMGQGQIVFEGTPQDLRANEAVRSEWLEV